MEDIEYVFRNDGDNTLIQGKEFYLTGLLKREYAYIYDSICENNYKIREDNFDIFKELLYQNKVVGFCSYKIISESYYILTDAYIIRGYRRQSLFHNELKFQLRNGHYITIREPTKYMVELLIHVGYAKKINNNLVISSIDFNIDTSKALNVKKDFDLSNDILFSNLYDLDICSTLSFKIVNQMKYVVYYTEILDGEENLCKISRDKLNQEYFSNIVSFLINNDSVIERWLFLLNNNISFKKISKEDLLGSPGRLSNYLIKKVNDKNLSRDDAEYIQRQLLLELKTGKVDEKVLKLRLNYLINHLHKGNKSNNVQKDKSCPYCNEQITFIEDYCINCGYTLYNLLKLDEREFVFREVLEDKKSYKYSLNNIKEKKDYFSSDYLIKLSFFKVLHYLKSNHYRRDIFKDIASQQGINYDLRELLIDKGYISFSMNQEKWQFEANDYRNDELKEILKSHGLKISGNKHELITRITDEVPLEDIKSYSPRITDSGLKFIEDNYSLFFHNTIFKDFVYEEYLEFDKGLDKEYDELDKAMLFVDKHISNAFEKKDHDYMVYSLRKKTLLYDILKDYNNVILNELKIFMINLNMLYIDSDYYLFYKPVEKETYSLLNELMSYITAEELNDLYSEAYNSFNEGDFKIPNYEIADVLREILRNYALNAINNRIRNRYYKIKENKTVLKKNNRGIVTLDRYFR